MDITHYRGDTFIRNLAFTDSKGAAINLTGSTIYFSVKKNFKDTTKAVSKQAVITDAAGGKAVVTVPALEMTLTPGPYVYDFQWTDSQGVVTTIEEGRLIINYDVTT